MILKTICLVLVCQKKQINLAVERRGTFTSSDRHCQPSLSILFSLVVCPIFIFFLFSDPLCNFPISWKAKPQQLKEECIKSVGRSRNGYPSSCYIRLFFLSDTPSLQNFRANMPRASMAPSLTDQITLLKSQEIHGLL